jgi:hypothetical protein
MIKSDFEMLITGCAVAIIIMLLNFGQLAIYVENLSFRVRTIQETNIFKKYEAFKKEEQNFWAQVKGNTLNTSNLDDLRRTAESNRTSPTPTATTQGDAQTSEPSNQQPSQTAKIKTPTKVLFVGDSMMLVGFGPALENDLLSYKDVSVDRHGAFSTGLNRIDYFDWYTYTDGLIAANPPDIMVVMFGANDGQGILDLDGNPYQLDDPYWKDVYRERVNLFLTKFSPKVKKIYWVGHPIAGNDDFYGKFKTMNPIYQEECAKFTNAVYVDTWERFSVNGEYSQSIQDDSGLWQIAKQSDGVHVTDFGGGVMSDLVIKEILKDVDMRRK